MVDDCVLYNTGKKETLLCIEMVKGEKKAILICLSCRKIGVKSEHVFFFFQSSIESKGLEFSVVLLLISTHSMPSEDSQTRAHTREGYLHLFNETKLLLKMFS